MRAALTILRAYIVAGRPAQKIKPFGRFEEWSDLIRSALVWLDCADPCLSRESLVLEDPVRAALAQVLTAWRSAIGLAPVTAAEIIRQATDGTNYATADQAGSNLALKDALEAALFKGDLKPHPLGKWLGQHVDRVVDGLVLRRLGHTRKGAAWRVEERRRV